MGALASVAILVPMLGRPHRVAPLLDSIDSATPDRYRVVFACTPGDIAVIEAINACGAEYLLVNREPKGDYARKINAGVLATTEPYVFLGADDLKFHRWWLEHAVDRFRPGVGVVGTQDMGNARVKAGEHATHSLVSRSYIEAHGTIDEPGKVLHEGYHHNFCDDELVGTAKRRGAWAFAGDSIVEHLHPNWNPDVPVDETYILGRSQFRRDQFLHERRKRLWT